MAHAIPDLKHHICKAVAENHRIGTKGLSEQWRKLIFGPLSELKNTSTQSPPIILVVDALDECEHKDHRDDVQVILRLLAEANDLPTIRLKVFLTSRLENRLRDGFGKISKSTYQSYILHHIPKKIVEHDILIMVQHEFGRIQNKHSLSSD